jgi:hypothetical protein
MSVCILKTTHTVKMPFFSSEYILENRGFVIDSLTCHCKQYNFDIYVIASPSVCLAIESSKHFTPIHIETSDIFDDMVFNQFDQKINKIGNFKGIEIHRDMYATNDYFKVINKFDQKYSICFFERT